MGLPAADNFVEGSAARMSAVFGFTDFTAFPLAPRDGVVLADLLEYPAARQVDAGVADVGEIEIIWGEPREGEGGGHAQVVGGIGGHLVDSAVDATDGVGEMGEGIGVKSSCRCFKSLWDDLRHLFQDTCGGDVAGISTAHAV